MPAKLDPDLYEWSMEPARFQDLWLGRRLWQKQKEIARSVWTHEQTAVKGCHASGKCVEESERLILGDGSRVRAGDLVGRVFDIPTLALDGSVISVEAAADWNATESVFAVETETGRRIVRNGAHPLWSATGIFPSGNRCKITARGWTPTQQLRAGDLVAVAEALPIFGRQRMDDAKLKVLAYLIGDGGYTSTAVSFTQQDNKQLREFRICADLIGCDLHQGHTPIDFRLVGRGKRGNPKRNPAINFLTELGIRKTHSRDKRIPAIVFELTREQIAVFLSRLYSTDGWASLGKHGVPEVGFCSASLGLVRDVQELLLKFGIAGRIQPKAKVNAWTLSVSACGDVLTFCAAIGIYGKEAALEQCRANAVRQQGGNQRRTWRWKGALPGTRWERVKSVTRLPGKRRTVAIEVPFHHTFLTSFYEHNTFLASGLPLNWLAAHEQALCFTISPTLRQVKTFWKEVTLARRGRGSVGSVAQFMPEPSTVGLTMAEDRYATGASSSKGVNIQGLHQANVLIITDESPGIIADIWDAIEGIRAGGHVRILKLGNPVVSSGTFFDAFNKHRRAHNCISISAFDTPNLQNELTGQPFTIEQLLELSEERLDFTPFPSLVTRRWVREHYYSWGPSNPRYQSRVLAQFPTQSQRAVFDLAWIERAKREPNEGEIRRSETSVIQIGIDVAGEGSDETAACARVNGIKIRVGAWADADPRGAVLQWIKNLKRDFPQWQVGYVVIDTVGIGYGFALHFADQGLPVFGFKAGTRAMDQEQYTNAKAENYFRLREMYRTDYISHMPEALDEECEAQLGTIEYEELPNGLIQIEPKKKADKRGIPSPDRAEAEVLAFCKVIPREVTWDFGGAVSISTI